MTKDLSRQLTKEMIEKAHKKVSDELDMLICIGGVQRETIIKLMGAGYALDSLLEQFEESKTNDK